MLYDNLQAKEARIRQREVDEAHQQCRLDSSCSSGGSGAVARSGAVPSASDQAAQSHGAAAEASAGGASASTVSFFFFFFRSWLSSTVLYPCLVPAARCCGASLSVRCKAFSCITYYGRRTMGCIIACMCHA